MKRKQDAEDSPLCLLLLAATHAQGSCHKRALQEL